MAEDWAAIRAEVQEAIASIEDVTEPDRSKAVLLRNGATTGPDYDPTVGPDGQYPVNVLLGSFTVKEIDGTLIQSSDVKVTIAADALSIEPTQQDRIEIGGEAHEVVEVMPLKPAGIVLMWVLACRSG